MDAVSYPNDAVTGFIMERMVPLRIPADHHDLGPRFRVKWTPTLLVLDEQGVEHFRSLGFVSAEELVPLLLLGMGKAHFNRAERAEAAECFDRVARSHPKSFYAAEAIYLRGVSRFIDTHEVSHLIEIYDTLKEGYQGSEWEMRADPYRLLKK